MSGWFDCISPFNTTSWTKVDNRSLSRSLLMLPNHFLFGRHQWKLPFTSKFKMFLGHFSSPMHWTLNKQRQFYLITSLILEIPIWVLKSDLGIFFHIIWQNKSILHCVVVSDKLVNFIYFNDPSFTSIQQDTTNTGTVCMPPDFQWDATIFKYWKQTLEILPGRSHSVLASKQLPDWPMESTK